LRRWLVGRQRAARKPGGSGRPGGPHEKISAGHSNHISTHPNSPPWVRNHRIIPRSFIADRLPQVFLWIAAGLTAGHENDLLEDEDRAEKHSAG